MGLSSFFVSAVSALHVSNRGMSLAGNNIANVNTKGYSKQYLSLRPRDPQMLGGVEIGLGIDVGTIARIHDTFIENRLLDAHNTKSEYETLSNRMSQVESVFNEVGQEGLSGFMTSFFQGFNEVATDASSIAARQNVLGRAEVMTDRFHTMDTNITQFRTDLNESIKSVLDKANSLIGEISTLTSKIKNFPAENVLVFNDERQAKLRELAEIIDIQSVETSDGDFQVYSSGFPLVVGVTGGTFSVEADGANAGLWKIKYTIGNSTPTDVSDQITGGSIGKMMELRDTTLPGYRDRLDELAYRVSTSINTIHQTGFNLAGQNNLLFFTNLAAIAGSARLISLHADVEGNPSGIAASSVAADIPSGNGTAKQLAGLQDANIVFTSGNTTALNYYSTLLSDIGIETGSAGTQSDFYKNVFVQTETERERASGVSIEEEEMDLVKFRAAYQAAARLISIGTEMLNILVNLGQ